MVRNQAAIAFRKPDPPGWLGGIPGQRSDAEVGRASRHVGENRLGNRRQRQTRVRHRERANKQKRREHQDLRLERRCGSEVLVLHQTVRRREYVDSNCIAFRNPFRAEHELESGLPHRLGRQDASSRIPRQSPQHRLERGERVGGVTDSQTPSRFGGGFRGALRRSIQFEHRIAWRRSAGGAAHHRLAFLGKDDSKRKRGMGRRLYHGATCLGERHSTRNRHGKTLQQDVIPANPAK